MTDSTRTDRGDGTWSDDRQLDLALIELARMSREIDALRARARDESDRVHLASLEAVRHALVTMVQRLDVTA
ncbi:MAG: hypothetical protein OHK0013_31800 [Sandaracinaceae bacterium]